MRRIAIYVERAFSLQFQMSLAYDTSLLCAGETVGKRILGIFLHAHLYALTVLYVNRRTGEVRQRQSAKLYRRLV